MYGLADKEFRKMVSKGENKKKYQMFFYTNVSKGEFTNSDIWQRLLGEPLICTKGNPRQFYSTIL